jgi:hypothetical protein
MSQVTRTTNELIVNSLYLTGELGVGEIPDAFMLTTGLDLINELLDKFAADSIYIPFLTTINYTFEVGKATYVVSDMAPSGIDVDIVADRFMDLSFATYTVPTTGSTSLIYPLKIISKEEYYGVIRQNNLMTRPAYIFMNKQDLYTEFTVYPAPDQPYPFSIQVKSMLNQLGNQSTLGELPPNYYGFLKYALARKFIAYYPSANWPKENEDEYQDYYNTFKNANETDLTIRPSVIFTSPEPFYWPNIVSY